MSLAIIYKREVIKNALYRFVSVMSLVLVLPVANAELGTKEYGYWVVFQSLFSYVLLFDLGFGNSLRNNISVALATDEEKEARKLAISGIMLIFITGVTMFFVAQVFTSFYTWSDIFGFGFSSSRLEWLGFYMSGYIALVLSLSSSAHILFALNRSSVVAGLSACANSAILIVSASASYFGKLSLTSICHIFGIIFVLQYIIQFMVISRFETFRLFWRARLSVAGAMRIIADGKNFFIIQICTALLFMSDKFLVLKLIGPDAVVEYEVIFRIFSVFNILHALVLGPLWPALSSAYALGSFDWIEHELKRQIKFVGIMVFMAACLYLPSADIVNLWTGGAIKFNTSAAVCMIAFVSVCMWNNVFSTYHNAVGRNRGLVYISLISSFLNIGTAVFFVSKGLGVSGVILSLTCNLLIYAIYAPLDVLADLKKRKATSTVR